MKPLSPSLSVASLLFAFPIAAKAVQIGGRAPKDARRGEKTFYVEGKSAEVTDQEGHVVGRLVADGTRWALLDAGGTVVARSGERSDGGRELRHARWVLAPGALDIGAGSPVVLTSAEAERASRGL